LAGQIGSALDSAREDFSQLQESPVIGRPTSSYNRSSPDAEKALQTQPSTPKKQTTDPPRPSQFDSHSSESQGIVIPSIERAPSVLQSPHTPRRSPFSDFDMDVQATPDPAMDTKRLMREARERASAKRLAESASREASTMPASPLVAAPNQMLPLRETVTEPVAPPPVIEPVSSPKFSVDDESDGRALRILPLEANEYVVPLPLQSQTRDIYVQTIRNNKRQRLEFLPDGVTDPNLIREIDLMMEELRDLCNHPDLLAQNDLSTQRAEPVDHQAKHAETISTKCIFIAEFIDAIRPSGQHIAIIAQPGRMREILEALLLYHGFEKGPDGPSLFRDASGGPLTIALCSTTEQYISAQPTSAIIAFDPPLSLISRAFSKSTRALISLVVSDSIEHLELCFEDNTNPIERKQTVVDCISQLQEEVGKLSSDYPPPPEAARLIAEFVMNMAESSWPIPPMPGILGLEFRTPQSQSRSDVMSGSTTQSYDMTTQVPQSNGKRQYVSYL
jgi:hypothetical protein